MTPKQYMKDDNYMVPFKDRVSFVDKKTVFVIAIYTTLLVIKCKLI